MHRESPIGRVIIVIVAERGERDDKSGKREEREKRKRTTEERKREGKREREDNPLPLPPPPPPLPSIFSVCRFKTHPCVASTHGCVLNLHTETFSTYTRGVFRVPSRATHTTHTHTPRTPRTPRTTHTHTHSHTHTLTHFFVSDLILIRSIRNLMRISCFGINLIFTSAIIFAGMVHGGDPGSLHSSVEALQPLRGRAPRSAARVGHGPCAAGEGFAAHCGAQNQNAPLRADPRCSCAAVWEPAGGSVPAPRFAHPRVSYRSAQDLFFTPSLSQAPGSRGADGGTVGGSAGIRVVCLSVPAADR